jgi:hypothetical protein
MNKNEKVQHVHTRDKMKKRNFLLIVIILVIIICAGVAGATVLKLNPIQDMSITSVDGKINTTNELLVVNLSGLGHQLTSKSLLKFDFSNILQNGEIVNSATLTLFNNNISNSGNIQISLIGNDWNFTELPIGTFAVSNQAISSIGPFSLDVKKGLSNNVTSFLLDTTDSVAVDFSPLSDPNNAPVLTIDFTTQDAMLAYYRGLGSNSNIVEISDLLTAANDWRNNIIPPGFSVSINTSQLMALADEWRNS